MGNGQVNLNHGLGEDLDALRRTVSDFARQHIGPLAAEIDRTNEFPRHLWPRLGELGLLGVPVFVFHEGGEPIARRTFEQVARLSRGAYCPFDATSARQLKDLLSAVAVYASAALGWGEWLYRTVFVAPMPPGTDPRLPSLLFALAFVATWWCIVVAMRRMGVRIRL